LVVNAGGAPQGGAKKRTFAVGGWASAAQTSSVTEGGSSDRSLAAHVLCRLFITQGYEFRVAQMVHVSPVRLFYLFMPKDAHGVPFDLFAIQGADHWYTVGAQRVRALRNDLADRSFRPGWSRSVGSGWVNWALESFMDEASHAAGGDPVAFRLRLLDGAGRNAESPPNAVGAARRQAAVLARVAQKAGRGSVIPNNVGPGVATTLPQ
jgi:CO/xanthine dehydrogenase Mo-binding subunit